MKKYSALIVIAITYATVTYSFTNKEDIKRAGEAVCKISIPARVISRVVFTDQEAATRYIKHAEFYAKKSNRTWINDSIVDLVIYPAVDNVVGRGMSKLNQIESVHVATENFSKSNRKFIANNVQLISSAAIVQGTRLAYDNENDITQQDIKNFGKCCAAQVGCDVVDEFLVKPAVEAYVGNCDASWTASIVRGLGNYVLATIVINNVSKYQ